MAMNNDTFDARKPGVSRQADKLLGPSVNGPGPHFPKTFVRPEVERHFASLPKTPEGKHFPPPMKVR
jgi:hypothetical protein